jgi:plastocyanin
VFKRVRPYLLGAAIAAVAALPLVMSGGSASAAATYTIKAGGGETGYSVDMFMPAAVSVNTGDTVHWAWSWKEPHTVTLGTPQGDPTLPSANVTNASATYDGTGYISSGLQGPEYPPGGPQTPTTFDVKFTKAGTYQYFCAIHPNMKGAVTVTDSGTPSKQADLDTKAASDYSSALASLKTLAGQAGAAGAAITTRADGTKAYTLTIGSLTDSDKGDVQQFFPPSMNLTAGDSITWKNSIHTPHTVTFGAPPPGDPFAAKPTGGPNFSGAANSGVIGVDEPNGTTFQLTFPAAGTFQYFCMLHANQGMVGAVTVAAAPVQATPSPTATTAAPGAPRTGSGVDTGSDANVWLLAGAIVLAIAATSGAVYATRR